MSENSNTSNSANGQSSASYQSKDYSKGGFIPIWIVLIVLGIAVEFCGRFFGYENNPLAIYHGWIPLGTAMLSGIIVVIGYFVFIGAKEKQSALRRRSGVLLMIMGGIMLATSFIFKSVIPLIFG